FYTADHQVYLALKRTLAHLEKWDEILDGHWLPQYQKPREQTFTHRARGLAVATRGGTQPAHADAATVAGAHEALPTQTTEELLKPLEVARQELEGHVEYAAHKTDKALHTLEAAAKRERALRYSEPTSYPRPVMEVLGQLAMRNNRLALAETAFREALDQYP